MSEAGRNAECYKTAAPSYSRSTPSGKSGNLIKVSENARCFIQVIERFQFHRKRKAIMSGNQN